MFFPFFQYIKFLRDEDRQDDGKYTRKTKILFSSSFDITSQHHTEKKKKKNELETIVNKVKKDNDNVNKIDKKGQNENGIIVMNIFVLYYIIRETKNKKNKKWMKWWNQREQKDKT
ncbi:hypothetical protein RFI_32922 [Reticulomyxa filosa]|uniref:Uncharacterized protein n=1 Tax=Reticulomyxa filosa TaxID=46433 RepID=X6LS72_RETFI|nr:hypothetical protein RFI_32922 [Reticulomyxa filosa]|eukprot:ETO04474.1 hypothetical protein RFI_32922 [Reticulomyxa filosa]